jgi:hypothetical protein
VAFKKVLDELVGIGALEARFEFVKEDATQLLHVVLLKRLSPSPAK